MIDAKCRFVATKFFIARDLDHTEIGNFCACLQYGKSSARLQTPPSASSEREMFATTNLVARC
jgi:hypothetical protein